MTSSYDSWLTTPDTPSRVYHNRDYPTGYECGCGGDEWLWDPDSLCWLCAYCGDALDEGDYRQSNDPELREEALLAMAGL